jgi:pimeloyl-ACP methyl ester carboxylesterase
MHAWLAMSSIKPFKISVAEDKIQRLKQKLALSDFPDEVLDAEPWVRGPPLSDIKRLAQYWGNGFDWRKVESELNKMPHFTTDIAVEGFGSYDVHFIHHRSPVTNAIPLLFLHGWPGSFIEVTKILPLLMEVGDEFPAFNVVAPSLVDFGFSSASGKVCIGTTDLEPNPN